MPSYEDTWSPRSSDYSLPSTSSHASDADDEFDNMSHAGSVEHVRDGSASEGESGRNSPSPSVYSYRSSIDGGAILRDIYGRTFNNTSEHYMLPADVAEHGRLDIQHEMLRRKRGGLFFAPQAVKRALAPREGPQPSVLDVGSGSGSWVIEMGRQFPHVEVVGVDLAPANLNSTPPPNCRFECDDANLGLLHYKGCFDVVHASCITQGLVDYPKFMEEAAEILRPGGVFLTVAGEMQIHDENRNLLPLVNEGDPGFTYTLRLVHAIWEAMRSRSPGIEGVPKIYGWLEDQGEVWQSIGHKIIYIPIGPWEDDMSKKDAYISELMRQDFLRMIQSVRPLLLSYGWFEETVDKWSKGAQDEITNLSNKYYIRWFFTWAVKPEQTD